MPLIDPPDYVAIDPILIYKANDLAAESYRRLLQIVGWLWVTRRNEKPLGVTIAELAERWQVAERTAYHTLQALGKAGYLTIHYSRGRTYLERGPRITDSAYMPGDLATEQAARGGSHTPGDPATEHNPRAMRLHEQEESCATTLHKEPNNYVVDVDLDQNQHHQHIVIDPAVQQRCTDVGIWPEAARELAGDPWVTEERVRLTAAYFEDKRRRGEPVGGRPVANVAALVVGSLKSHREPPRDRVRCAERDRNRYIEGDYAEFIKH